MKLKSLQFFRFIIQVCFMAGLFLPFLPHPDVAGRMLFWTSLLVGVFFCGWGCPFGAAQDWLAFIARKFKLPHFKMPWLFQKYVQFSRYLFIGTGALGLTFSILNARYAFNHDLMNHMLDGAGASIVGSFLVISLFFDRPFCNYFCIKGAVDGLLSIIRPVSIKRSDRQCIHCHLCNKVCPMNVRVENTTFVRHPNCINCMKCISCCPQKCLSFRVMDFKKNHIFPRVH